MGNYYGVWDKKSPSPLEAIRTELGAPHGGGGESHTHGLQGQPSAAAR
jgi:hypothetical protein